jgi:chemotaxis family two-component system sensor kinase Cph1
MKTGCYGLFLTLLLFTGAAQAAEGEDLLRTVFADHGAIMLFVAPDTGDIVDVNQAAANFYDYPIDTLRHKQIQDINQLGPAEVAAERAKAEAENRNYFIFPHRLANGEMRTVEVYSSPIRLASGRVVLFSIVHDITGKHVAEQALLDYQNQLGELVARRTEEALAARNWIEWLLIGGLTLLAVVNALLVYHYIRRRQTFRARGGRDRRAAKSPDGAGTRPRRIAALRRNYRPSFAGAGAATGQLRPTVNRSTGRADRRRGCDAGAELYQPAVPAVANLLRDVQLYLVADQPRGPMAILDARTVLDQVLQRLQSRLQAAGAEVVIGALPPVQLDAPRLSDLWTVRWTTRCACVSAGRCGWRSPATGSTTGSLPNQRQWAGHRA